MNLLNHTRAWSQLQGVLRCQAADGFVPHMCHVERGRLSTMTQPPLLAWAVWDNYLFARDKGRLEWAAPRLAKCVAGLGFGVQAGARGA